MINYFIYTIISLSCSYAVYFLLLRKQKTFQFNRFFLIGSLVLCLLAPLLEIKLFNAVPNITEIPIENFSDASVIFQNIDEETYGTFETVNSTNTSPFIYLYLAITLFLVFRFLKNILQIYKLTKTEFERYGKLKIIKSNDSEMVSSFFNYMFINENHTLEDENFLSVIKHESVHSEEKHTLDIIFIELLLCAFWFNPFVWLYKKAMLQNHEYIADHKSVSSGIDIENYSNTIINLGHKEYRIPLTSGFNFIQIKNRIIMLHQSKSSVLNRTLKITSVILLFAGIFVFSCAKEDTIEPLVVVIDAAHGGKDSGNLNEKDIVLNISNKLSLLSNTKVKIITTRDTDNFSSLEERVNFINTQNADLVISLHCNAYKDESISGVEAYYYDKNDFKDESYEYSKILVENQLELFSNSRGVKTASMYVLKEINSPGVVLELGFMSNKKDMAILMNPEKQKEIANVLFESLNQIGNIK